MRKMTKSKIELKINNRKIFELIEKYFITYRSRSAWEYNISYVINRKHFLHRQTKLITYINNLIFEEKVVYALQ